MRRLLITVQMGLMLVVGCGQATYDERLEQRISELKNVPAPVDNDTQDEGDEETTEGDEGTTEEGDAAEEEENEA